MIGFNEMGRPFAGPPGIPEDRLKILRQAFEKALKDPEVIEIAKKTNRPINYVSYQKAESWAKGLFKLPPNVVEIIKGAYGVK